MHTRFNLEDLNAQRRSQQWAGTLSSLFPLGTPKDVPPCPDSGSVEGASFDRGRLWRFKMPMLDLHNATVGESHDARFSILLVQDGRTELEQEDCRCHLESGGFGLIDGSRQFKLSMSAGSQHVLLQVPRALVASRYPHLLGQVGQAFTTGAGGAIVLRRLIEGACEVMDRLTPAEQSASLASVLALLDAAAAPVSVDNRVRSALAEIELAFCDPDLSAQAVAASVGVSRRRLDELFKDSLGEPVAARIWTRRLEEAAHRLRALEPRSITDLALSLGFEDSAHFARMFRRRFGASPREWRQHRH